MPKDPKSAFLDKALRIVKRTAPAFKLKSFATRGMKHGLLTQQEVNRAQGGVWLPDWIIEGLSERMGPPVISDKPGSVKSTEFLPGLEAQFYEPKRDAKTELPPRIEEYTVRVEPMIHYAGGFSRHNLVNYRHIMLNDDGSVGALTEKDARFLAPLLAEAEPVRLPGHCFLCVVPGAVIYAHWILDTLPRLLSLKAAGIALDRFESFVFADATRSYHTQVLDMLGIPQDRVYSTSQIGPFVECASFEMVGRPRTLQATHPLNLDLLRRFFFGDFDPPKSPCRRIYISRQRSARRRIINGEDVGDILKQRGFEEVFAEDHSFTDMARIMADARYLIGPHGAGFTNAIFSQIGTRVCEIFGVHLSSDYWRICGQLGHDYCIFQGLISDGRTPTRELVASMPRPDANGSDILVDLDRFTDFLDKQFLA